MKGQSWAIVLAGGEGTRIKPLIEKCIGFPCPKQYFAFCGDRTMLEHTIARAAKLVGEERIVTVIGNGHRCFLENRKIKGHVIEQPTSRGTGAAVFLGASYIRAQDPEATVVVMPSDHFIYPRRRFLNQVNRARLLTECLCNRLILLGATPDLPETDYGWIEPGAYLDSPAPKTGPAAREVNSFHEKPSAKDAQRWFGRGYLWNTMIVVVKLKTLWSMGHLLLPNAIEKFETFLQSLGEVRGRENKGHQDASLSALYSTIPSFNFSYALLSRVVRQSAVVPLEGILWSDWGREERVLGTLRDIGKKPVFLTAANVPTRGSSVPLVGPQVGGRAAPRLSGSSKTPVS